MQGGPVSDRSGDVERDESTSLISSEKVEGTAVYDTAGNKLGSIHSVMIGKTDGRVSYAVLSFGGFLGIGTDYYPVPWNQLKYDTRQDGYVIGITREQLEGAPRYGSTGDWQSAKRGWSGDVDRYYTGPAFPSP
ncbi:photosystem reaction center subunit H [Pseudoroseomonas deserti]|uniref:Photosystem reaction center subunit H n=2 Tax=Teichococcus deserti TaxID=1817963 RepID=A0A1V2H176_9PROT|nr:photosystem reaction center subunit H [Pseudoroseomonas deserti]